MIFHCLLLICFFFSFLDFISTILSVYLILSMLSLSSRGE